MKINRVLLIGSFILALAATLSAGHVLLPGGMPWLFPAALTALILSMLVD